MKINILKSTQSGSDYIYLASLDNPELTIGCLSLQSGVYFNRSCRSWNWLV